MISPTLQAGDRLGEAKMLMSIGESTAVTEGKAKADLFIAFSLGSARSGLGSLSWNKQERPTNGLSPFLPSPVAYFVVSPI